MLRGAFICVFVTLYILVLGPPLLIYTFVTRHVDPLYWAGVNGVIFLVRCVGVRVHVKGLERIPPARAFLPRITRAPRTRPRWCGPSRAASPFC